MGTSDETRTIVCASPTRHTHTHTHTHHDTHHTTRKHDQRSLLSPADNIMCGGG
jgi:hypothetical protein